MKMAPENPPRYLGLDLGQRRIGLAVSDPLGLAAQPAGTVERKNDRQAVEAVARVIDEYEVAVCVAGLPVNMDGTEGPQARRARSFIGRLRKARPHAAYQMWDERLTSLAADELLDSRRIKGPRRKALRDQLAAMVILEEYLRHKKHDKR